MNVTMDKLDQLAASAFDGYLVRKDLVRKYARQYPVPTYVVEFLLGRYCASTDEQEIAEGLEIVEKQLRDRTVRTGEEELFKARAKEQGSVKLIDLVRARLDTGTTATSRNCRAWRSARSASPMTWCARTSGCSPMASMPK
jgi:ATP-dependent Lon protease